MSDTVAVVALVRDLMDRSRFDALTEAGALVRIVRDAEALVAALHEVLGVDEPPGVTAVVDLSAPDALRAIGGAGEVAEVARVVAFGSHVDRERLDEARAAGAEVLARSAFFARLGDLVRPA